LRLTETAQLCDEDPLRFEEYELREHTQVLVIGGGPSGTTTATLLAKEGFDVTLVERASFPRYHIGESLLPSCLPILDLIGARQKVEEHGFQIKRGVYFDWGGEEWEVTFGALVGQRMHSFQVLRAEFDHLLLENAKSRGVTVIEGFGVESLCFDGERPTSAVCASVSPDRQVIELDFDFLIDASGRAGILATRYFQSRRYHQVFRNIAMWGYWRGAKRLPVGPEGAIAVCSVSDGWFWGIPLHDGTLGVGLVTDKEAFNLQKKQGRHPNQIYQEAIRQCPRIADLLASAELTSDLRIERDYSYTSDSFAGPGYRLVGDAACFLDPLLSTGVHLAMFSGLVAAASIASVLRHEVDDEQAAALYEETYRQAYLRMMVVVSTMYQQYRGKESYFWEAQQLTLSDCDGVDLRQAFLNVISGIEDLQDAQMTLDVVLGHMSKVLDMQRALARDKAGLDGMSPEERERTRAKVQFSNLAVARFSLSPRDSIRGLYVVTRPRLGLAHVVPR
jgi:flavin-dependent dehydrogenase